MQNQLIRSLKSEIVMSTCELEKSERAVIGRRLA